MGRGRKIRTKKNRFIQEEGLSNLEEEKWRQYIFQLSQPLIPMGEPIHEFPYVCFLDGPVDPGRYPDLDYLDGKIYHLRKSRWSNALVEIRGPLYKTGQDRVRVFKYHIVVSKEVCKQHLKRIEL